MNKKERRKKPEALCTVVVAVAVAVDGDGGCILDASRW